MSETGGRPLASRRFWAISVADESAIESHPGLPAAEAVARDAVTPVRRRQEPWRIYLEDLDHPDQSRNFRASFEEAVRDAAAFGADEAHVWSPSRGYVRSTLGEAEILD
jgi:hypothetical protein